jgi:hypothetical protein
MRALTFHGKRDVRVDNVPDPEIKEPTDAIVRITSTAICGSDLHLYEVLGPFIEEGDILGHEPMGIVEEVGSEGEADQSRRPRGDPVQHLLRRLLDVQPRPLCPVRDDPGPRARQGGLPVRLHEALRRRPRRPGRIPACAAGPHRTDQGPGQQRPGRALPVPLRRPPHRLLEQDDDPLEVEGLATHRLPLDRAPAAYEMFQKKEHGAIKIVLEP